MEDGSSLPLWGIIILFMLFLLNGIFYGFAAAVQNLSEGELQRRALEGDKKAIKLLEFMNHPSQYVNAIPLMVISSGFDSGSDPSGSPRYSYLPQDRKLQPGALCLQMAWGSIVFFKYTLPGYHVCYLDRKACGKTFWHHS